MNYSDHLKRAVFLDRDGVINQMVYNAEHGLIDSPQNADQFELLPRVGEAVRNVNRLGLLAVVVSNQPGIAKGKSTPAAMRAVTEKMTAALAGEGARLDAVYYCLHHPEAVVVDYRVDCDCRKPKPGLLAQAQRDLSIDLAHSYVVGDGLTDVLAGQRAGCRTILLGRNTCYVCRQMSELGAEPSWVAPDLLAAVQRIEAEV